MRSTSPSQALFAGILFFATLAPAPTLAQNYASELVADPGHLVSCAPAPPTGHAGLLYSSSDAVLYALRQGSTWLLDTLPYPFPLTSLRIDNYDNAHTVSADPYNAPNLVYGYRFNDQWFTETVASGEISRAALSLDPALLQTPGIAYRLRPTPSPPEPHNELWFARRIGASAWSSSAVAAPEGDIRELAVDFGVDRLTRIAYTYFPTSASPSVMIATLDTLGGYFNLSVVSQAYYPSAPTLATDAVGNPVVAFLDGDGAGGARLRLASETTGTWTTETIDSSATLTYAVPRIAVDGSGAQYVAYFESDQSKERIRCAHRAVAPPTTENDAAFAFTPWLRDTVIQTGWLGGGAPTPDPPGLVTNYQDVPEITYTYMTRWDPPVGRVFMARPIPAAAVEPPAAGPGVSMGIRPNPVTSGGNILLRVYCPGPDVVKLAMYDLAGRLVRDRTARAVSRGWIELRWELGPVPPSVYIIAATSTSGATAARRLVVVK